MNELYATRSRDVAELMERPGVTAALERYGTPLLLLEPDRIRAQYRRLTDALPFVEFFYAVKALAHPVVIDTLAEAGCGFDVASIDEIDRVRARGVPTSAMIFTHPVKKPSEIAAAQGRGMSLFVADNPIELRKIAATCPGASVVIRLAYRNPEAKSDLSTKFGAATEDARELTLLAIHLGLDVLGFSFHAGSQSDNPAPLVTAVERTLDVMDSLESTIPIRFEMLDIGGGFPVAYDRPVAGIEQIAAAVRPLLRDRADELRIIAEPGRVLVAESMTLITSVVGAAQRAGRPWVYLDDGVYGAYSNVVAEDVHPLVIPVRGIAAGAARGERTTVAGPTCDSADVITTDALLPELAVGELVASPAMGAYTLVTATTFNGRGLPHVEVIDEHGSTEPVLAGPDFAISDA